MKNNKILYIVSLLFCSLFLLSSCSEELNKADFDYVQNPAALPPISFQSLEKVSDTEILAQAKITSIEKTLILDQGFFLSERESFENYSIVSVKPDTVNNEILVNRQFAVEQGIPYYFKAFALTKDGLVVSNDIKSITLPLTWQGIGTADWTDGIVCRIFTVSVETYNVDVEEMTTEDNKHLYRMVNPYGFGVYPYTEAGDVTRNPAYVLIDATDPNNVTIQEQGIGIDFGYGEFFIRSNGPGKMVGKTITFPAGSSLVVGMRNYNNGQPGWYANDCILVLP